MCDCGGGSAVTGTTTAVYCCTVPLAYCYHTHSVTHSLRTISGIRCTLYVISMLYVMITNFDSIWDIAKNVQGVPKIVSVKPIFEFQTLGGVLLGVKNNSKNFGNKKIVGCL